MGCLWHVPGIIIAGAWFCPYGKIRVEHPGNKRWCGALGFARDVCGAWWVGKVPAKNRRRSTGGKNFWLGSSEDQMGSSPSDGSAQAPTCWNSTVATNVRLRLIRNDASASLL